MPKTNFYNRNLNFVFLVTELQLPSPAQLSSIVNYNVIKCANCNCIFNNYDFQNHVCDYNEDHKLIVPPISKINTSCKNVKDETPQPPSEPACIRLLRENQIRIRRFLKEELKYDVNSNLNNVSSTTASTSNSVISSCNSSNASLNINKKQDGPHECTLCERKFVHASGLLRHMEKHALDLIPSTPSNTRNTALQAGNNLRVVIKCTLCGRIFFESNEALKHLYSHFPGSKADEKEMDNYAEIPYDVYVDGALNSLKSEVKNLIKLNKYLNFIFL